MTAIAKATNIIQLPSYARPRQNDAPLYAEFKQREDAPFSEEAEKAVLGAVLIDPAMFLVIQDILTRSKFFFLRHDYIWRAFERLAERGEPIDPVTVADELHGAKLIDNIGVHYITQLINAAPTSLHAEIYARVVERHFVRRELIRVSDEIRALAHDTTLELEKVCADADTKLAIITRQGIRHSEKTISEAANRFMDRIEAQLANETKGVTIPTGWSAYNEHMGGLERGTAMALLGYTGIGKSHWLTSLAYDVASLGFPVGLMSNELTIEQMTARLIAIASNVNVDTVKDIRRSPTVYGQIVQGMVKLAKLPITLDYSRPMTPQELRGKAMRIQRQSGLDVLLFDGIYNSESGNPIIARQGHTAELMQVSRELVGMAKELDLALVYTQQAKNGLALRTDKRPTIADSEYSHRVVQDADIVLGLHREYVFDKGVSPANAELICLKNRDGGWHGSIPQYFNAAIPRFEQGRTVQGNLGDNDDDDRIWRGSKNGS